MRIVHLSTVDSRGGAARSAFRLHRGLSAVGIESSMLVKQKSSRDEQVTVASLAQGVDAVATTLHWDSIQTRCIYERRTAISNTHFSLPGPGYDLSQHPLVAQADIIHLHWVSHLVSPPAVAALGQLGKPLVWTLHDQRPFTGGCHFSAGCRQFETDCATCPQLTVDRFGLTSAALADAIELFGARAITVVSPSRWLADCARSSKLFRNSRVEVIPYGLETDVFRPRDKATACTAWQLNPRTTYFLFGAFDWAEKRKGIAVLAQALEECRRDAAFGQRLKDGSVEFLCFGQTLPEIEALALPVRFLGQIDSDDRMASAYSAAAAVLLPSLEDNLPNVLLEAMCCGTPVIAHRVGGVPDVVEHGVNGLLVPTGDARQFGEAIRTLAGDPDRRETLSANCRREIPPRYTLAQQARRYRELYEELLKGRRLATSSGNESAAAPAALLGGGSRFTKIFPSLLEEVRRHHRWRFLRRLRRNISRYFGVTA
ncbi:MAG: glycosyltransferase [Opitutaceae bacterium]|nr:glycosyltransferase [Verrucomicrobiales bacterium]